MKDSLTIEKIRQIALKYGGTPYRVAEELHLLSDCGYEEKDLEIYEYVYKACRAEELIRERYNPQFSLEEIDYEDEKIQSRVAGLVSICLPKSWMQRFMAGEMPGGQAMLAYQICFLRVYYEKEFFEIFEETSK